MCFTISLWNTACWCAHGTKKLFPLYAFDVDVAGGLLPRRRYLLAAQTATSCRLIKYGCQDWDMWKFLRNVHDLVNGWFRFLLKYCQGWRLGTYNCNFCDLCYNTVGDFGNLVLSQDTDVCFCMFYGLAWLLVFPNNFIQISCFNDCFSMCNNRLYIFLTFHFCVIYVDVTYTDICGITTIITNSSEIMPQNKRTMNR